MCDEPIFKNVSKKIFIYFYRQVELTYSIQKNISIAFRILKKIHLYLNMAWLYARDEPRPNIVYTYFHFQVKDNRWRDII